jgi:hypothetical protein
VPASLYRDKLAGSATLTASGAFTTASQTETVKAAAASKFAFTTPAQTLTAGVVSGTITATLEDAFGNAVSAGSNVTVALKTSSTSSGIFRDTTDKVVGSVFFESFLIHYYLSIGRIGRVSLKTRTVVAANLAPSKDS